LKRILLVITLILIIVFSSGAVMAVRYLNRNYARTVNQADSYFILKKDTSLEQAAKQLEDKKIIRSSRLLMLYARVFKLDSVALPGGRYILKPNTALKDLVSKLESDKSDFAVVTIPEGFSLHQIADRLENNNLIKKEDLLALKLDDMDEGKLLSPAAGVFFDIEGYLFPDTYYIPYEASVNQIIQLMFGNFTRVFSEKHRQRAKELGLSINDIVTIASLIEKEAANNEERSRIAGVIYNRIKKGMLLQIDAAVIYAHTKGETNISRVTYNHLRIDSKYNTYVYKGIPPGPIASPGRPSIEAALYPEDNAYLYYVATGNGHAFSKTYEEHLRNVKKYIK
jgi:UPF0755 protein